MAQHKLFAPLLTLGLLFVLTFSNGCKQNPLEIIELDLEITYDETARTIVFFNDDAFDYFDVGMFLSASDSQASYNFFVDVIPARDSIVVNLTDFEFPESGTPFPETSEPKSLLIECTITSNEIGEFKYNF